MTAVVMCDETVMGVMVVAAMTVMIGHGVGVLTGRDDV